MRLLWLTLDVPFPPDRGARIRNYQLLRRVGARHDVRLRTVQATPAPDEHVERLHSLTEDVQVHTRPPSWLRLGQLWRHVRAGRPLATFPFFSSHAEQTIREDLRRWTPDVFQIEHSFLAPYVELVSRRSACRTVLSLHNAGAIQYDRMRNMRIGVAARVGYYAKALLMRGWETRYARRFDRVVTVSTAEQAWLQKKEPSLPVKVVPNGVDAQRLVPSRPDATFPPRLLFVGTLEYAPNVDAVLHFCSAILPRVRRSIPDVQFVVVGHAPPAAVRRLEDRPGIVVPGGVPDVQPYYRDATVSVVPLRAGSGTRLKILEAMALGRPVVSTTLGCEGLDVEPGRHLLVADAPSAFAKAVVRLLTRPALRRRMAADARALVEARYDWSAAADRLLDVYTELETPPAAPHRARSRDRRRNDS